MVQNFFRYVLDTPYLYDSLNDDKCGRNYRQFQNLHKWHENKNVAEFFGESKINEVHYPSWPLFP